MISVVAPDQNGLLATICRWFSDAGVSIQAAWITGEDEANDVFVVSKDVDVSALEKRLTAPGEANIIADVAGDMFGQARDIGESIVSGRGRLRPGLVRQKWRPDRSRDLYWSGGPGSNRRPRPWQGRALPTELPPQSWSQTLLRSAAGAFSDFRASSPAWLGIGELHQLVEGVVEVTGDASRRRESSRRRRPSRSSWCPCRTSRSC